MESYSKFLELVADIESKLKLKTVEDSEYSFSFLEDEKYDVFKILFKKSEFSENYHIYVSFHLDLIPEEVLSWYFKLYNLNENIKLLESYFLDDNEESYFGKDAKRLREYKHAQFVISEWIKNDEDTEEFLNKKFYGRESIDIDNLSNDEKLNLFNIMRHKKDDIKH